MVPGQWYASLGVIAECMGLMDDYKHMMIAVNGDESNLQSWPLNKDVIPIKNPYE